MDYSNNLYAIVRPPCREYVKCISNHPQKATINTHKAREQHEKYIECLKILGCKIIELQELKGYPDSCFVEDRCVVTDDVAAICQSRVSSRKGEELSVSQLMLNYRQVAFIRKPGYIDGGDIIVIDNTIYGGLSKRTNIQGLEQLADILNKNLTTMKIPTDVLHLKTISSFVGSNTILVREDLSYLWENMGYDIIKVPLEEEPASNCIAIGNGVIAPVGAPKTVAVLRGLGMEVHEVDMSEFQKGDGSLTCLSLIFGSDK